MSHAEYIDPTADEALRWFARLQSGSATAEDRLAFQAWLDGSARRQAAYAECAGLWTELDGLRDRPFPELDQARAEWTASGSRRPPLQSTGRIAAALAAVLAAVVAGVWWWTMFAVDRADYRTVLGEQRTVTLGDGSTMALNTATHVSVRMSGRNRTVELHDGEALFTVAHEAGRPFIVETAHGAARDVGTEYLVRRQRDRTAVAVLEGVVEVSTRPGDGAASERRVIRQGEQVSYGRDGRISPDGPVDAEAATAWLQGKLVFERARLADVIAEIARYRAGEIRLLDQDLASLEVSGVFNLRELQTFPRALEQALPVKATPVDPHLTIVERIPDR